MRKKLIVLGMCTALLLSGCGVSSDDVADTIQNGVESAMGGTDSDAGSEATEAPQESEAPEEQVLALGQKAKVGDWKFKVTKAQTKKQVKNGKYYVFRPGKGQQFIIISLAATNKGKKEGKFLPRMGYSNTMISAKLYYEDYEYKATDLMSYDKDLLDKSIKPLTTEKGIVAFEVPKKVAKKKGKITLRIGTDNESVTYQLKK